MKHKNTARRMADPIEQLRMLLGDNFPFTIEDLVNQDGTQYSKSLITLRPTTLNELQKMVRAVVSVNLRVRAVGNCFSSWPGFPESGGVAIHLENLVRHDGPRIQLIRNEQNPVQCQLTALSSVTVEELLAFQLENGVEMMTNVVSRHATVGGITTTATHGTGLHCKSVADTIAGMRVVDASGELRVFDSSDPDTFNAVRGGLGLFGVIYDVTFHVSPISVVQVDDRWIPANEVFFEPGFFSALVHNNVSLELHWCFMNSLSRMKRMQTVAKKFLDKNAWDPGRDEVYVRTINRPTQPMAPNTEEWFDNRENPVEKVAKSRQWFSNKVPATMPMITHKMVAEWKQSFMGTMIQTVPRAINYFAPSSGPPLWHMEFSFDLDPECENIQSAISTLCAMIQHQATQGRFPVFKMGIRFTAASDIFLSPSFAGNATRGGSGNTCHIDVAGFPGTAGWHEFVGQLGMEWMAIPGARPNWGRQWSFIPGIVEHLKQTCRPELEKFRKVLEERGHDKTRMFFTEFMEHLLYGPNQPLPDDPIPIMQPDQAGHPTEVRLGWNQEMPPQETQLFVNGEQPFPHPQMPVEMPISAGDVMMIAEQPKKSKKWWKSGRRHSFDGGQPMMMPPEMMAMQGDPNFEQQFMMGQNEPEEPIPFNSFFSPPQPPQPPQPPMIQMVQSGQNQVQPPMVQVMQPAQNQVQPPMVQMMQPAQNQVQPQTIQVLGPAQNQVQPQTIQLLGPSQNQVQPQTIQLLGPSQNQVQPQTIQVMQPRQTAPQQIVLGQQPTRAFNTSQPGTSQPVQVVKAHSRVVIHKAEPRVINLSGASQNGVIVGQSQPQVISIPRPKPQQIQVVQQPQAPPSFVIQGSNPQTTMQGRVFLAN